MRNRPSEKKKGILLEGEKHHAGVVPSPGWKSPRAHAERFSFISLNMQVLSFFSEQENGSLCSGSPLVRTQPGKEEPFRHAKARPHTHTYTFIYFFFHPVAPFLRTREFPCSPQSTQLRCFVWAYAITFLHTCIMMRLCTDTLLHSYSPNHLLPRSCCSRARLRGPVPFLLFCVVVGAAERPPLFLPPGSHFATSQ